MQPDADWVHGPRVIPECFLLLHRTTHNRIAVTPLSQLERTFVRAMPPTIAPRPCLSCPPGSTTLEFQRHDIDRPVETPGVAIVGSLWLCGVCGRAAFVPDSREPERSA